MNEAAQKVAVLELLRQMREHDSWCGETHVQKCAFFLQEGLGAELGLNFVLYKHGPYSFDLHELLGRMRADQLIELQPKFPYGPSIVATPQGVALCERGTAASELHGKAEFVAEQLGPKGVAELERLGTALYVRRHYIGESTQDEQARRIVELKPHVSEQDALQAVQRVDELLARAA